MKAALINLVLGHDCNFNCIYCQQHFGSNIEQLNFEFNQDTVTFIANRIAQYNSKGQQIMLYFTGGETLMYIDKIKTFLDELSKYKLEFTTSLSTNGLLLNDEVVEFANKHNIYVTYSHDGKDTKSTRGMNLLEDSEEFRESFKKLNDKSIRSTITSVNQDFNGIWEYYKKFDFLDNVIWSQSDFYYTSSMPRYLLDNFDYERYVEMYEKITAKAIEDFNNNIESRELSILMNEVGEFKKGLSTTDCFRCGLFDDAVSVTFGGDIIQCLTHQRKVTNVSNFDHEAFNSARVCARNEMKSKACNDCELGFVCTGCPYFSGEEFEHFCKVKKIRFTASYNFIIAIGAV